MAPSPYGFRRLASGQSLPRSPRSVTHLLRAGRTVTTKRLDFTLTNDHIRWAKSAQRKYGQTRN